MATQAAVARPCRRRCWPSQLRECISSRPSSPVTRRAECDGQRHRERGWISLITKKVHCPFIRETYRRHQSRAGQSDDVDPHDRCGYLPANSGRWWGASVRGKSNLRLPQGAKPVPMWRQERCILQPPGGNVGVRSPTAIITTCPAWSRVDHLRFYMTPLLSPVYYVDPSALSRRRSPPVVCHVPDQCARPQEVGAAELVGVAFSGCYARRMPGQALTV